MSPGEPRRANRQPPSAALALTAALLLSISSPAQAADGGSWALDVPLQLKRQECGAARIGRTIYVAGGLLEGVPFTATDTVEAYDIDSRTWSFIPDMPDRRDHCAVTALDGRLYVIGGFESFGATKADVFRYDPQTSTWQTMAPLPQPRGAGWAVTHGGKIYLFGGDDAARNTRDTTYIYDPQTNLWSTGAPMPTPREHLVAARVGEFIYVIGGRDGVAFNVNERYDPVANTWQTMAPMPTARSAPGLAAWGRRIVVAGGEIPRLFEVNEIYDAVADEWRTAADMPVPRHGLEAAPLDDRLLFPAGGIIQGLRPTAHVDRYKPPPATNGDPNAVTIELGVRESGALHELFESDDAYIVIEQRPAASVLLPLIRAQVDGAASIDLPSELIVTAETAATALPGRPPQKLSLFDHDASAWTVIDSRLATLDDALIEISITAAAERFIGPAPARPMHLRLEWFDPGNVISPAWTVRIDLARWDVLP